MKSILLSIIALLLVCNAPAVAGKQEKKNKVKTITLMQTIYENGKPITFKESVESFDKSGNTVSYEEFSKDGTIVKKEAYRYDKDQNIIEEIIFNSASNKNYKKTYKYSVVKDKTPLIEESEFSLSGTLVRKTVYSYFANGKKASETVTDGAGSMISKTTYQYNSKDLKTQKQTVNKNSKPESQKEWQYIYY